MKKSSKIIATIGIVFGAMFVMALFQIPTGPGGRPPGIIGLVVIFAMIAGIRAIWKSPKKQDDIDSTSLRKD